MRSLFRYLINNYSFFLFLLLEIISLAFVFNFNSYQKVKYLNSASRITGSVYNTFNSVTNYFELGRINKELAAENANLRSSLENSGPENLLPDLQKYTFVPTDSGYFRFVSAKVINNSVNKPFNYITLNKGSRDGVKPDQGIISSEGIVGVVTHVTPSYSLGLSVLNQRWTISSKLKNNGTLGSLVWNGKDYRYAGLTEIPFHVIIQVGDTVVTSGYSSIFPEGILIGTVHSFEQPQGENYYNIEVELSTNFKALSYVEVIENKNISEIKKLETVIQDATGAN